VACARYPPMATTTHAARAPNRAAATANPMSATAPRHRALHLGHGGATAHLPVYDRERDREDGRRGQLDK